MNLTVDEMLRFCRLCQSKRGVFKILADNLSEQIFQCTNIKIEDDLFDVLPSTVCEQCKTTICEFCNYLQAVRKVDADLRRKANTKGEETSKIKKDINRRLNYKGENKKFKCPVCLKKYTRLRNLQVHKRQHSVLFCFSCDIIFDDAQGKSCHDCNVVKTEKAHSPTLCENMKFNNESVCVENEVSNINPAKKEEQFEDEFPVTTDENTRENDLKQNDEVRPEPEIITRSKKQELENEGNFKCKTCNKEFSWRVDLWLHRKNHKITYRCKWENCNKICTSAYTLKTHEMNHEGKRPFLCVTCGMSAFSFLQGKGFVTKNSLNCHEKIHLKVKPYSCEICKIGFAVRSNLRAHEQKHHEGMRFYCSKCTRTYISKSSLERHERIHTGIREFQCGTCPSAFYTNKELIKHQRYHQGLRRYKCDQCFKSFFEKHHLTIHLRVHTGEKPYACKISGCGKSFTESQKLSRHLKARHTTHIPNV